MRYDLRNHGGTRLGELMLAEGVTLADAGSALMRGSVRIVPARERVVPQVAEDAASADVDALPEVSE